MSTHKKQEQACTIITDLPLQNDIAVTRQKGPMKPNTAWDFIEKYIDMYINIIKDPTSSHTLYLLLHEQLNPVNNQRPLTKVACQEGEQMLSLLLLDYWQTSQPDAAAIASRLTTSALIALAEHPSFVRLALGMGPEAPIPEPVWDTIRNFVLTSLKTYHP